MTDATKTADILAAWQLIEEHGLAVYPHSSPPEENHVGWWCHNPIDGEQSWPIADTPVGAVKAWAESAGVPWPAVRVVPMWAWPHRGEIRVVQASRYGAQSHADACGMGATVIPCEVVIRETEGE